jgi:hypothetical protein
MNTLTDRYVHAATRFVQEPTEREELGLELRERIEDTVAALIAEGHDAAGAERQALTELGDPLLLSAEYRQRPTHLIGPRYFYTYLRILLIAVSTSAPVVGLITALAQLSAGGDAGDVIGGGIASMFSVAVHVGFWTTFAFAVLERVAPQVSDTWNPDMLPQTPGGSSRRADLIATLVALVVATAALVWQHVGSPFIGDDGRIAMINPDLWSPWLAIILVLLAAEGVQAVSVYRRGWTWATASTSAVLALAFAAVTLPLLLQHQVLNPELIAHLGWEGRTEVGDTIAAVTIAVITLWEVVAGFVRAARRRGVQEGQQAVPA